MSISGLPRFLNSIIFWFSILVLQSHVVPHSPVNIGLDDSPDISQITKRRWTENQVCDYWRICISWNSSIQFKSGMIKSCLNIGKWFCNRSNMVRWSLKIWAVYFYHLFRIMKVVISLISNFCVIIIYHLTNKIWKYPFLLFI